MYANDAVFKINRNRIRLSRREDTSVKPSIGGHPAGTLLFSILLHPLRISACTYGITETTYKSMTQGLAFSASP